MREWTRPDPVPLEQAATLMIYRLAADGLWISKLLDSLEISAELRAEIGRQLDAMSRGVFPKARRRRVMHALRRLAARAPWRPRDCRHHRARRRQRHGPADASAVSHRTASANASPIAC